MMKRTAEEEGGNAGATQGANIEEEKGGSQRGENDEATETVRMRSVVCTKGVNTRRTRARTGDLDSHFILSHQRGLALGLFYN